MTQINTISTAQKPAPNTPPKGLRTTTFVRAGGSIELPQYMLGTLDIPVVIDLGKDSMPAAPKAPKTSSSLASSLFL